MQKVKIFSFRAVDCSYDRNAPYGKSSFSEIQMNRAAIENVINDFIKDKKVVSITPSISTVLHHNNGGYDTENIIYTIVYEEGERWYAVTRWCVEDVIAAAEQQGITLTEEQAARWWKKNERSFSEMLVEDGNERLSYMNFEEDDNDGER